MEDKLVMLRAAEMLPEVSKKMELLKEKQAERLSWLKSSSTEELEEKLELNIPLPEYLQSPPWRVPDTCTDAGKINRVLEYSMQVQASSLPSCWEFPSLPHCVLSDSPQNVSIILRRCLAAVGVKADVMCGVFRPLLEDGPAPAVPMVFLDIQGHTIDNSYSHQEQDRTPMGNMQLFLERFSPLRTSQAYVRELPSVTSIQLVGEEQLEGVSLEENNYLEVGCSSQLNQDKLVVMQIEKASIHPGTLVYEKLMREFIRKSFRVGVAPLRQEMQAQCWSCQKPGGEELKTCTGCKVARYCGKECLQKDWDVMHKSMHKITKKREKKSIS